MASTTPQPYNNTPGPVAPATDRYNVRIARCVRVLLSLISVGSV
jgi:hypothetical protein